MARAIWSGTLTFGLVTIPVKLYPAVQRKTVRFHQLDGENLARIQQRRVNSSTGEEVPYERLVKGYEVTPDRYVVITPDELDSLDPKRTRTIEIEDFVDGGQIDPILYDSTYYVAPAHGRREALPPAARRDGRDRQGRHRALRDAHEGVPRRAAPVGRHARALARCCSPTRSSIPARSRSSQAVGETEASKRELDVAKQLIGSLAADFDASQLQRRLPRARARRSSSARRRASRSRSIAEPEPERRARSRT